MDSNTDTFLNITVSQLLHTTTDLIVIINQHGTVNAISTSVDQIVGYAPKDFEHKHISETVLINTEPGNAAQDAFLKNYNCGKPFESVIHAKNDNLIRLSWNCSIDRISEQVVLIGRNISEILENAKLESIQNKIDAAVINSTDDLIWSLDRDYKFTSFNSAFKESRQQVFDAKIEIGLSTFESIEYPKEIYNYWKGIYDKVLAGESTKFEYKSVIDNSDNSIFEWHKIEINPIYFNSEIIGLVGKSSDITQVKKATEILQNQQEALREAFDEKDIILEDISDAFYALDEAFNFIFVNKQAYQGLYKSNEDLLGRNLFDIFPELKGTVFHKKLLKVVEFEESESFEFYYEPFDRWFDERIYKTDLGYSVFFIDISERKKLDFELQAAYYKHREILESITDGFLALDRDNRITYINNIAQTAFRVEELDVVGKHIQEIFFEEHGEQVYNKIEDSHSHKRSNIFEYKFEPNGNWFKVNIYPSANGLSIYFRNISKEKEVELKLLTFNDTLKTKNEELEQFAFAASHDLQEPLRVITSFLDLLQRHLGDAADETSTTYINYTVDASKRMRQIIIDLLDYSRAGSDDEELEEVDPNYLVDEIKEILKQSISSKRAVVTVEKLPKVLYNSTALRQVFLNLISNAIKYVLKETSPEIEITCNTSDGEHVFCVQDNGIGIDQEYHEHVFTVFKRLHNRQEYEGTGIGLSICKKIIEKFNGSVWIDSAKGEGSKFYFTIPRNQEKKSLSSIYN